MFYLIDGYNVIFSLIESKESLQSIRQKVVLSLQKKFAKKNISGMIVFDGAHLRDEGSGKSYPSPLIVAYAPKGQSADEYIIEQLEGTSRPKQVVVVTNDKGLGRQAKSLGATVTPSEEFISWLHKSKKKTTLIEPSDTKSNIERLQKIFEEKLKDHLSDFE